MWPVRTETLLIALSAVTGAIVTLQAPLNAELGRSVGDVTASVVSFGIGFLVLVVLAGATGQLSEIGEIREVSWYYLLGGVIGAAFVLVTLIAVPKAGAGPVIAAAVCGQLIMAAIVDWKGWFGVPQHDLTPTRLAGIALLLVGVVLVSRK